MRKLFLMTLVLGMALGCEQEAESGDEAESQAVSSDCRNDGLGCRSPYECLADDDEVYACRRAGDSERDRLDDGDDDERRADREEGDGEGAGGDLDETSESGGSALADADGEESAPAGGMSANAGGYSEDSASGGAYTGGAVV